MVDISAKYSHRSEAGERSRFSTESSRMRERQGGERLEAGVGSRLTAPRLLGILTTLSPVLLSQQTRNTGNEWAATKHRTHCMHTYAQIDVDTYSPFRSAVVVNHLNAGAVGVTLRSWAGYMLVPRKRPLPHAILLFCRRQATAGCGVEGCRCRVDTDFIGSHRRLGLVAVFVDIFHSPVCLLVGPCLE